MPGEPEAAGQPRAVGSRTERHSCPGQTAEWTVLTAGSPRSVSLGPRDNEDKTGAQGPTSLCVGLHAPEGDARALPGSPEGAPGVRAPSSPLLAQDPRPRPPGPPGGPAPRCPCSSRRVVFGFLWATVFFKTF